MEERRSSAWRLLTHDLLLRTWDQCRECCEPLQHSSTANTIMDVFDIYPWPLRFDPHTSVPTIASVHEHLERLPDVNNVCIRCDCGTENIVEVTACALYALVHDTLHLTEGLCLKCVQEGSLFVAHCFSEEHA